MLNSDVTHEQVREYYSKTLQSSKDLKTSACCTAEAVAPHLREVLCQINPEILERSYGCGSPIPLALEGRTVLDLGCGTGRDVYLLSKLVGRNGMVYGVDMTEEQLAVAERHLAEQTKTFGYETPNVKFFHGYIEDLKTAGIEDESVDVVVSNCVINLSPDKERVFSEIFRILKPGGELYFSDVFTDRRVSPELTEDPVLHGECLSGALYIEDFRRLLRGLGNLDYRTVSKSFIEVEDPAIRAKVGNIRFCSMTVRAFKLGTLEDICEDYGQVAIYRGTIAESPNEFELDDHHVFAAHKPKLVCGNTASMLEETRFAEHFRVIGDRTIHFGPFDCSDKAVDDPTDIATCC